MITEESIRWAIAGLIWVGALFVLSFNLKRHFSKKNISGIPFLFTIFCLLGAIASPLEVYWVFIPALIFEIPALGNFKKG